MQNAFNSYFKRFKFWKFLELNKKVEGEKKFKQICKTFKKPHEKKELLKFDQKSLRPKKYFLDAVEILFGKTCLH